MLFPRCYFRAGNNFSLYVTTRLLFETCTLHIIFVLVQHYYLTGCHHSQLLCQYPAAISDPKTIYNSCTSIRPPFKTLSLFTIYVPVSGQLLRPYHYLQLMCQYPANITDSTNTLQFLWQYLFIISDLTTTYNSCASIQPPFTISVLVPRYDLGLDTNLQFASCHLSAYCLKYFGLYPATSVRHSAIN